MDSHEILTAVYEIQGLADSAQAQGTLAERMQEIYEIACRVMQGTGFHPDGPEDE